MTDINVKRYEETGLLFPLQVLEPAEVDRFREAAEETERALREATLPVAPGERPVKMDGECHLNFEWAHSLCTLPAILDVVEKVIGPDILIHSSTLFFKRPGKNFVSWHQDSNYNCRSRAWSRRGSRSPTARWRTVACGFSRARI